MQIRQLIQSGKKNNKEKGFTLIEVLIAMAIFAIGILGIAKLQMISVNGNADSREYTEGSSEGVSRIETVMMSAYDDPALNDGTTGTIVQGIYTINWTVTEADPIPNVKKINMVVTWNNKSFTANYYKAVTF